MRKMLLYRKSILFACLFFTAAIGFTQVTEKWVQRLNGNANDNDEALALVIDRKGNVIVTGFSISNGTGADYATVKYDNNREEKWVTRFNGPGNGFDIPLAIAADHKGNVYVTGTITAGTGENEIGTIKYDDDGNTKWVQRFNGPGFGSDQGSAIAADKKGNVYITGSIAGNATETDIISIKYDKNGDSMWVRIYNGPGNGFDRANAIAVDDDGNTYVTGVSAGNGTGLDITTIKYDEDGDLEWVQRYNGANNSTDEAQALTIDTRGNVYVTGSVDQGNGNFRDIVTIKYNKAGQQQWVATYHRDHESGTAIAVDDAGNVYLTGVTGPGTEDADNDYVTIKYNSAGVQQWVSIFASPGDAQNGGANDLVLDANDNVYITGVSAFQNGLDYATIKYNTNGAQQWVAIYNGPGNGRDLASGIGLDKKGNVYVTGFSEGNGTGFDYATIKYEQTPVLTRSSTHLEQNSQVEAGSTKLNAKAFPNAFTEFISLQWSGRNNLVDIIITDELGRLVVKRINLPASGTIQTGYGFRPGTYYAEIMQGTERVVLKLIKR
jgi:hypothetical protein